MRAVVVSLSTDNGAARHVAESLANGLSSTGRDCTLLWVLGGEENDEDPPHVHPGVQLIRFTLLKKNRHLSLTSLCLHLLVRFRRS
jgi:hypothetical protein